MSVENLKILPQEAKKYNLRLSLNILKDIGIILLQIGGVFFLRNRKYPLLPLNIQNYQINH